jgi:hypothetical protein
VIKKSHIPMTYAANYDNQMKQSGDLDVAAAQRLRRNDLNVTACSPADTRSLLDHARPALPMWSRSLKAYRHRIRVQD